MKSFKIIADPRVKSDLEEAISFLESKQIGLSKKFLDDYKSALKKLEINPYYQVRYKEISCLPLKTFKYMLHFKVNKNDLTVTIFAIISTHRNPGEHWL